MEKTGNSGHVWERRLWLLQSQCPPGTPACPGAALKTTQGFFCCPPKHHQRCRAGVPAVTHFLPWVEASRSFWLTVLPAMCQPGSQRGHSLLAARL